MGVRGLRWEHCREPRVSVSISQESRDRGELRESRERRAESAFGHFVG